MIAAGGGLEEAIAVADRALGCLPLGSVALRSNLRTWSQQLRPRNCGAVPRTSNCVYGGQCRWGRIWSEGPWDPVQFDEVSAKGDCPLGNSLESRVELVEQAVDVAKGEDGNEGEDDVEGRFVDVPPITRALVEIVRTESSLDLASSMTDNSSSEFDSSRLLCEMELVEMRLDSQNGDDRYRRKSARKWPAAAAANFRDGDPMAIR